MSMPPTCDGVDMLASSTLERKARKRSSSVSGLSGWKGWLGRTRMGRAHPLRRRWSRALSDDRREAAMAFLLQTQQDISQDIVIFWFYLLCNFVLRWGLRELYLHLLRRKEERV